jgi:hypothetical protein
MLISLGCTYPISYSPVIFNSELYNIVKPINLTVKFTEAIIPRRTWPLCKKEAASKTVVGTQNVSLSFKMLLENNFSSVAREEWAARYCMQEASKKIRWRMRGN